MTRVERAYKYMRGAMALARTKGHRMQEPRPAGAQHLTSVCQQCGRDILIHTGEGPAYGPALGQPCEGA